MKDNDGINKLNNYDELKIIKDVILKETIDICISNTKNENDDHKVYIINIPP